MGYTDICILQCFLILIRSTLRGPLFWCVYGLLSYVIESAIIITTTCLMFELSFVIRTITTIALFACIFNGLSDPSLLDY